MMEYTASSGWILRDMCFKKSEALWEREGTHFNRDIYNMLQMGHNGHYFPNISVAWIVSGAIPCFIIRMFHYGLKRYQRDMCVIQTHGVTLKLVVYAKPSVYLYVVWLYMVHRTVQCWTIGNPVHNLSGWTSVDSGMNTIPEGTTWDLHLEPSWYLLV